VKSWSGDGSPLWFSKGDQAPFSVEARFATWPELTEFLAEKRALVDVWAYGEAGEHEPRRIPAPSSPS
jgi:hypothetical protein